MMDLRTFYYTCYIIDLIDLRTINCNLAKKSLVSPWITRTQPGGYTAINEDDFIEVIRNVDPTVMDKFNTNGIHTVGDLKTTIGSEGC